MNKKEKRIKEIEEKIFQLECSDDGLMSNRNGQRDHYLALKSELAQLRCTITQTPAVLLHKHPKAEGLWLRTKIICIETGFIFDNLTSAAKATGCGKSAMSNHLNGRFKHVRGLHFARLMEKQP